MIHGQKLRQRNLNCKRLSGTVLGEILMLICRHGHRDLLKTANTVIDMREILDDVEIQYRKLIIYTPDLIAAHANNAEQYQMMVSGSFHRDLIDFRGG